MTAASKNSSASTRRSPRRGLPRAAGTSKPPAATPMSPMSSSAPPAFSTSRCFPTSPAATALPAPRSTRRTGITACPMPASAGASSAAAPAACRSPRRWPGPACDVTQFIRRAQWVHIRENPHSTWRERLKLRLPGGYQREQRRLWQFINEFDRWRLEPGPQREAMEREYGSYLECIKDPELKAKLTPDYNLGCTRIPKSDKNYYEAVQLPNAHIVKGQIARIVPEGVVHGGRDAGRSRRPGLRHRLRRPCLYAADAGHRPQRHDDRRGVEGEDLFLWRHRAAGLSQSVHALWTRSLRSTTCRCHWGSTRRSPASCA